MLEQIVPYLTMGIMGGIGQLCRAAYGIKQALDRGEEIKPGRLIGTLLCGFISGMLIGVWCEDPRTAFLAGISTTDIIEGIMGAARKSKK